MWKKLFAVLALVAIAVIPASASITIKEFKRLKTDEQTLYIAGAVNMLAYSYAADGNAGKARCIQDWLLGEAGKKDPAMREITVEIALAERSDPERLKVEGIILGLVDKNCGQSAPRR